MSKNRWLAAACMSYLCFGLAHEGNCVGETPKLFAENGSLLRHQRLLAFHAAPFRQGEPDPVGMLVFTLPPSRPGVTKANFERIQPGMTRAEVEAIFGGPRESLSYITPPHGITTITDEWFQLAQGVAVGWASINFKDEVVVDKEWFTLPETFFQKIMRWLHLWEWLPRLVDLAALAASGLWSR